MNCKYQMRQSETLKKLRAGEIAFCTKMNLADPRAFEIAAMSGLDCLWTCQEHIGNDYRELNEQILAAKAYDCDILCRVPKGSYSDYIRPLEMDVTGIMVPHVMNFEEAERIVRTTRFHPIGKRPVDGGNADGAYTQIPFKEYIEQANRERFVILQIEDPEPLQELDKIAELPGYDILFFGPGDFSHSIGDPGNFDNPFLVETRKIIAETAKAYGKFAGTVGTLSNRQELIGMGYSFISIGADVVFLCNAYRELTEALGRKQNINHKNIYSGK